jgi:hypothetical protein
MSELREYEYTPLTRIQQWVGLPPNTSLFDSVLVFENYPVEFSLEEPSSGLRISDVRSIEKTDRPLTLTVVPGEKLSLQLTCRRDHFNFDNSRRILFHLRNLLGNLVNDPTGELRGISMRTDEETLSLVTAFNEDL